MMKTPEQCANLQEIRAEIDRIDREVIAALGQRFAYVKAAAKFKTSEAGVKASDRFAAMLAQRREWAAVEGVGVDRCAQPSSPRPLCCTARPCAVGGDASRPLPRSPAYAPTSAAVQRPRRRHPAPQGRRPPGQSTPAPRALRAGGCPRGTPTEDDVDGVGDPRPLAARTLLRDRAQRRHPHLVDSAQVVQHQRHQPLARRQRGGSCC